MRQVSRSFAKRMPFDFGAVSRFDCKKKGATGITTVAPSVAGQWGRGDNRLSG